MRSGLHFIIPKGVLLVEDPLGKLGVRLVHAWVARVPVELLVCHQAVEHLLPSGVETVWDKTNALETIHLLFGNGTLSDSNALLADPGSELSILGVVEGNIGVTVFFLEFLPALELAVPF